MDARPIGQVSWPYSVAELWADGIVHGLGVAFVLIGSAAFVFAMAGVAQGADFAAGCVYLASLFLSIGLSATYNVWPVSRTKWLLRRFDHSAIFVLIAGTYTPLMVWISNWAMLTTVWTVAAIGVALKLLKPGRFDRLSIALYVALGWSGIVLYEKLVADLPEGVLALILVGGIVYSLGIVFHVWEKLRFQNVIWHGFVLAAAIIHFAAVWTLVAAGIGSDFALGLL